MGEVVQGGGLRGRRGGHGPALQELRDPLRVLPEVLCRPADPGHDLRPRRFARPHPVQCQSCPISRGKQT